MGNNVNEENRYFSNYNEFGILNNIEKQSGSKSDNDEVSLSLSAEAGKNFFRYLRSFDIAIDNKVLILPANSHYFYDENELKGLRTVISLKNLNLVNDPENFLSNLFSILPDEVNFVGCISYSKIPFRLDGLFSVLSSRFNNLLDSRKDHNMDEKRLSRLLRKYGFKVVDMTEIDGVTYFYSQNLRQSVSNIA